MAKKRQKINKYEEKKVHPDSPDGLLVVAINNRAFGNRFVEEFKKLQKKGNQK
ncbi:hypothetical protein [Xenorhabdus sp. TS4]|uniref:hypothetical protein n=1 Tax=Xenorhabdus sp. TS4 TaxID=1873483 RepID=UPI001656E8CE|nr:hypothetical protein [Xenorhabdus sp. TS4]MBC8949343.1 hypothetical protein [Xenorhabdus sp. TS4]